MSPTFTFLYCRGSGLCVNLGLHVTLESVEADMEGQACFFRCMVRAP